MNDYDKQADDFLKATNTTMECTFLKHGKHFENDTEERDIYNIVLSRGHRSMTIKFGQSLNDSGITLFNIKRKVNISDSALRKIKSLDPVKDRAKIFGLVKTGVNFHISFNDINFGTEPTSYDVLACLTKYDPGSLENFCDEFGYDLDSKSAEKIYNAVREEYLNVCALFGQDEMEQLIEIQ